MSERLRTAFVRLREYIGTRRRAPRRPVRLDVTLRVRRTSGTTARPLELRCHTQDISKNGIALVVPAIRVGDVYLTGTDVILRLTLDLPDGTDLTLGATPVRYHRLDTEPDQEHRYLIGARVVEIGVTDRTRLDALLNQIRKSKLKVVSKPHPTTVPQVDR